MGDKPSDDEANEDVMSDNQSEVDANEAIPTTPIQSPSQQAPESRAWSVFSKVKSAVATVASPFKFLGRYQNSGGAATTNGTETEFTFTHPHQFNQPPTTPTRSSKQRSKPQSERRSTTASRRISQSSRAPQTERMRRHVDKSQPLHLRGAPSASDMNDLREEQAATRRRQRESEIASLEQNDLNHGKSFRVPDSDDSDDDDGDNQDQVSEDEMVSSAPKKWDFLVQTKPNFEAPVQAEDITMGVYVEKGSQSVGSQTERRSRLFPNKEDFPNIFPDARKENSMSSASDQQNKSAGPSSEQPQYVYISIPELNNRFYRRINTSDEDDVCLNMFGEEARFVKMRDGSYRKMDTPWDVMKGHTWMAVRAFERNPANQAGEKRAIEAKWARLGKEKRRAMGIEEPASNGSSSAVEDTSAEPVGVFTSRVQEAEKDVQSSAVSNKGSAVGDSSAPIGYFTSMMQQIEKEAAQSSTESNKGPADENTSTQSIQETGSTLQQKQWNQTPPPKPRPSNAQLPQPTAAELALANANKYQPKKPSGLRNVTQMSPLQLEQENRAQEAEETKEVEEELAKITEFPDVWLPPPRRMEFPVPEGFPGSYQEFSDEIEHAVDVAWRTMHPVG
jgi:hypothetical protein